MPLPVAAVVGSYPSLELAARRELFEVKWVPQATQGLVVVAESMAWAA